MVNGSAKSCLRQYSEARRPASRSRNCSTVSAGALFGGRFDLITATSRTGLAASIFASLTGSISVAEPSLLCQFVRYPVRYMLDRVAFGVDELLALPSGHVL